MFRDRSLPLVLLFFVAVACVMTYPLARFDQPVLPDVNDSYFNVWRLAWVAHQIGRDPFALFDTNIFYPLRNTLAYSDAMLALGLIATPAINLGLHPVIVHNVLIVAAFVSAAFCAYLLCRHLTGSTSAALVGGLIFGFAPYRFGHIGHLELLWTAPMPLALLILHKAEQSEFSRRNGLILGAVVALQAYCSLYYAAFLTIFIGLWTLISLTLADGARRRRLLYCVITGGVTGLLITAPYGYVYYNAHRELGARDAYEIRTHSARPSDYLRASVQNKVYRVAEASEERSLFPGITAAVLGVCALLLQRGRRAVLYGLLMVLAFDLSLGLNGLTYPIIASGFPLINSLRAPARFSALFLLSLSVLGALGAHALVQSLSSHFRTAVITALAVLCLIEYWSAPLSTRTPVLTRPAVHQWLRAHNDSVILELPVPTPTTLWLYENTYQYMSIFHWSRLVNGYSGFAPRSYIATLDAMKDFPGPASFARLQELGVQYVIVHERNYEPPEFVALVNAMMQSPFFEKPLTMPDDVDPAFIFPVRPAAGR